MPAIRPKYSWVPRSPWVCDGDSAGSCGHPSRSCANCVRFVSDTVFPVIGMAGLTHESGNQDCRSQSACAARPHGPHLLVLSAVGRRRHPRVGPRPGPLLPSTRRSRRSGSGRSRPLIGRNAWPVAAAIALRVRDLRRDPPELRARARLRPVRRPRRLGGDRRARCSLGVYARGRASTRQHPVAEQRVSVSGLQAALEHRGGTARRPRAGSRSLRT